MRPRGSVKALERRRQRAIKLLNSGLTMAEVGQRVGASIASVCRWKKMVIAGGRGALVAKPVPGRPRKLTNAQCRQLLRLLRKGARAYGHPDDAWTLKRVAQLIRREFGIKYHPNHVWRLLRRCGWSR